MVKPIRIGINALGPVSKDTGGRTYLINISKYLALTEPDVNWYFFVSTGESSLLYQSYPNYPYPNYHFVEIENSLTTVGRLYCEHFVLPELIQQYQLDAMYYPGNFASWNCPVPYALAIRSMLIYNRPQDSSVSKIKKFYRRTVLPRSAKMAKLILTPSLHTKNEIVHYLRIPPDKIFVVPHGIDVNLFSQAKCISAAQKIFDEFQIQRPFLLYVSALWEYKNHDKLILAFHRLRQRYSIPHQLVFVGQGMNSYEGYAAKIHRLISELQLDPTIRMIPFLPHEALVHLYQHTDLFIFPSMTESFGNPIFEAMAAGVPVLCSNAHAMEELAGQAAFYTDPNDTEVFADHIHQLLTNTDLRHQLIQHGKQKVQSMTWQGCCNTTARLLFQIIQ